jgi:hypothetical protein
LIILSLVACSGDGTSKEQSDSRFPGETGLQTTEPTSLVVLMISGVEFSEDDRDGAVDIGFYQLPANYLVRTEGCTRSWETDTELEFLEVQNPRTWSVIVDGVVENGDLSTWPEGAVVGVTANGGEVPTIDEPDVITVPGWESSPSRASEADGSVAVTWTPFADGALARLIVLGRGDNVLDCFFADTGAATVDAADVDQLGDAAIWRLARHSVRLTEGEGYTIHAVAESGTIDF